MTGSATAAPPEPSEAPAPLLPGPVLELALPPESIARFLRHPALGLGPLPAVEREPLILSWHDTPDHALFTQGRALCRDPTGWALEEVRPGAGLVAPLGAAARIVRSAAQPADLALPSTEPLQQVAEFVGVRHRAASVLREVEVLDGRVVAGGAEHPACRVRLRGYAPAEAALLAEALPLSVPSEALPAFALRAVVGGALPEPVRTRVAEGSVRHFSAAAVAGAAASVHFWCARAQAVGETDPEPIHQARVAIRRLRSVLRVLRPAIACPDLDVVEAELRATFATLGACRDLDVFRRGCGADIVAALPNEPRLGGLLLAAERRRARAWADVRRRLASPAWRSASVRLAAAAVAHPWVGLDDGDRRPVLDDDARLYGRRALRRARRKVLAAGAADALPDEALHALRRRCKRLRYAAELFAPCFPPKPARRFLRRLARVQDVMGQVNDSAVAAKLASELARSRTFAGGAVAGWTAAADLAARRDLTQAWERFRRAEPFWQR